MSESLNKTLQKRFSNSKSCRNFWQVKINAHYGINEKYLQHKSF